MGAVGGLVVLFFGMWVVIGLALWTKSTVKAKCPNCGFFTMRWGRSSWADPPGFWRNMGILVAISGVLIGDTSSTTGSCAGGGIVIGLLLIGFGMLVDRRMVASCSRCHMSVSNSQMRMLLSGAPLDNGVSASSETRQAPAPAERALVECPVCKEHIREGALKCRHCGSELGAETTSS